MARPRRKRTIAETLDIPDLPEGGGFCIEITDFPGVDIDWLKSRAMAIESAMADRLNGRLEWQKVVANRENQGSDILFQVCPAEQSQDNLIAETLVEIVREVADPESVV